MKTLFVSYAHENHDFVAEIKAQLERVGFTIWQDIDNLRGGLDWRLQISDAIKDVDIVLLVLSEASVRSRFVRMEWETALQRNKRLLPILLGKCRVPKKLIDIQYIDFSDSGNHAASFATLVRDLLDADNSENSTFHITQSSGNHSIQIGQAQNITITKK